MFHDSDALLAWGRTLRGRHAVARPAWREQVGAEVALGARHAGGVLPVGLGRSYGDSGLNVGGAAIVTTGLDRLIAFDPHTRLLRAEAGLSLAALLDIVVPRGFFLPVTPGSRYVTLGGALANDVHGKNHHGAGTFGRWVRRFGLVRSDGVERTIAADDETGLFAATIGGLGLTGLVTWVEFELLPIASAMMRAETVAFATLPEFFDVAGQSDAAWDYTVAWIDCLASGVNLGRGIFTRGRHAASGPLTAARPAPGRQMPVDAPSGLLNRHTVRAFNALYYTLGRRGAGSRTLSYLPFFYPLDAIGQWNRLYGRHGFYQYQSVVPPDVAQDATAAMLGAIAASGQGSFLAVLKTFGPLASPGMLSFPRAGTTLALDFRNRGASTLALFDRLDAIVREAGGRLYPAKDGRIPAAMFRAGYPAWEGFARHVDPGFSSSFWRRVTA